VLDIKLKLRPGHSNSRDWMAPSPLKTLFWNVTYACNYRCPICFTDSGGARRGELVTKEALDLAQKAHEAGVHDVLISGGEPFLREDILTILAGLAKLGTSVRIASNGSLLNADLLAELRRETLTRSFQISLDTVDPDLYASFHGTSPTTLAKVLENLRLIQKEDFHTTISVRLTPETLPGIPGLLDLAAKEGWSTVTIHLPVHTNRVSRSFGQTEDTLALLRPVLDYFCSLPERWLLETYIPWAEYHPVMCGLDKDVRVVHRGCRAGRDRLTISPQGWLSPCVCLDVPAAYLGNVRTDDLRDCFERSPLCEMMRRPGAHGICPDCPNLDRCGGGCRAAGFAVSGRLAGQDESCPIWKLRTAKAMPRDVHR
jgi:radical SAM protein with 4Fe4S-binding SPASM domain